MIKDIKGFAENIGSGDFKAIARALSIVENDGEGSSALLEAINIQPVPVVGITGPPGAGKSTLVNAVTGYLTDAGKKVAILAVDPTSPFNYGSLLGDRIRMAPQFNKSSVFIRSLATRGALGGISSKTIEMTDVLKAGGFDLVIIETVGVGQSEVEIAGIADKTIVVLVPESGDEIQSIKSGLMEVAQAFVINKADREGAETFANNIRKLVHQYKQEIPVFKTVADKDEGISELAAYILRAVRAENSHRSLFLAEKAYQLILHRRMRAVNKKKLHSDLNEALAFGDFNIYRFVENWVTRS